MLQYGENPVGIPKLYSCLLSKQVFNYFNWLAVASLLFVFARRRLARARGPLAELVLIVGQRLCVSGWSVGECLAGLLCV